MNCPKCNATLKEGAKFCTSCGTKIEQVENHCPVCKAVLKPGAKFCTSCGARLEAGAGAEMAAASVSAVSAEAAAQDVSSLKQRIIWNVQPGEIAREITAQEFDQYKATMGIIINEGTTALIRMNGETIAQLHSGTYDFADTAELERLLKKENSPVKNVFGSVSNFLVGLFTGKKVHPAQPTGDIQTDEKTLENALRKLQANKVYSILLALDTEFPLVIGAEQQKAEDYADFMPMNIRTKNIDVNIGIRAFFKINDFQKFAAHYMVSSKHIAKTDIIGEITPLIIPCVQRVLRDVEITDNCIPGQAQQDIMTQLKALSQDSFFGLEAVRLIEISAQNQDLERLRKISEELYLSGQELDYLQRTNDFKNRLTDTQNNQAVTEAASDLDLYKRLQQINNDKLLADDELEKFYMVLSRERKIREAKNEDEIAAALSDIERTGLMRAEDLDTLKNEIEQNKHKRGFALKMMQLKDAVDYEKARSTGEQEIQIQNLKAQIDMESMKDELEEKRYRQQLQRDIDARKADMDLKNQAQRNEYDLNEQGRRDQFDRFREMAKMKQEMENQKHQQQMQERSLENQHQQDMQRLKTDELVAKYRETKDLTPEQLMAIAANENLSPEAAARFAESFSAGKNLEQQQQHAQEMNRLNDARVSDMKEMMKEMMATTREMSGNNVQRAEQEKQEYRDRLYREQERHDRTQDRALDYTTRNNIGVPGQNIYYQQTAPQAQSQTQAAPEMPAPATAPAAPSEESSKEAKVCKKCGALNAPNCRFCENCGNEI